MKNAEKERLKRLRIGEKRGVYVANVFKKYFDDLSNLKILDIGCGYGSLTLDFARMFKKVHSIDAADKEVAVTKKRVKENKLKNVTVAKDNALNIKSTKDKFDVIHLSGVFEWLRLGDMNISASEAQDLFLKNIRNFLRNDKSILYSGTENKLFPYFWLRDPHFDKKPLFVLLPEKFADRLSLFLFRRKYPPKIYSYFALKRLFKEYFEKVDFYVPIPHYQYVFSFANINNKKEIVKQCRYVLKNFRLDKLQRLTVYWILLTAKLGLIKLFAPGFITVARKPRKKR